MVNSDLEKAFDKINIVLQLCSSTNLRGLKKIKQ